MTTLLLLGLVLPRLEVPALPMVWVERDTSSGTEMSTVLFKGSKQRGCYAMFASNGETKDCNDR